MSSEDLGETVRQALLDNGVGADDVDVVAVSDGGEGLIEALMKPMELKKRSIEITGPMGTHVTSHYAYKDDLAVIEMAKASGLEMVDKDQRTPMNTTTRGVGEMIMDAINQGHRRIIVGAGGSATSDGGLGALQAMGLEITLANGIKPPIFFGRHLEHLESIHMPNDVLERIRSLSIEFLTDVTTPFTGPRGAVYTFSGQKGANEKDKVVLEQGMVKLESMLPISVGSLPGAGAAGGLPGGFVAYFGAKITKGMQFVCEMNRVEERIQQDECDYIITGEGSFDRTSLDGKAVTKMIEYGRLYGVPVIVICGRKDLSGIQEQCDCNGELQIHDLVSMFGEQESLKNTRQSLSALAVSLQPSCVKEFQWWYQILANSKHGDYSASMIDALHLDWPIKVILVSNYPWMSDWYINIRDTKASIGDSSDTYTLSTTEIYCIDKMLLNSVPSDYARMDPTIRERVLKRLLSPNAPKFSYKSTPPPASPKMISSLVDDTTTVLDLTAVPSFVWFSYCSLHQFPFAFLGQACPSLTSLTVTSASNFGAAQLEPFLATVGHSLLHLDVSRCIRINDSALNAISVYCPQLETLNIVDCIGVAGSVFQRAMPHLSGCKSIPARNLYGLATAFPSLRHLSLAKTFLGDEEGATLVQTLPASLQSLDLSFNPIGRLTATSILPNAKSLVSFRLRSLNLGYCRCITTQDVKNILMGLSHTLEVFAIPGCYQIDSALLELLSTPNIASQLRTLDISFCNQFTTSSLRRLCRDNINILQFNHNGLLPCTLI
eukprot:gene8973-10524_t